MITYKAKSQLARMVASSGEYPGANDDEARAVDKVVDKLERVRAVQVECAKKHPDVTARELWGKLSDILDD